MYVDKIIESMPNDDNLIVEIGPGLGDLTEKLLQKNSLVAYEIDDDLCKILKDKFNNLELVCGDVLDSWQTGRLREENYNLIANLPYYVATKIILKALNDENCKNILVLIQKEVAEKFSANVGDKNYSSLAIIAQTISNVEIKFDIPPTAFNPAPKVMSSVILFKKFKPKYDENFAKFLKVAFSQPRKTLLKNLSSKYNKKELEIIFDKFNIQKNIRPHQISKELFFEVFSELKGETKNDNDTSKQSNTKS
jgi:16S rRNA (adenine1518-N6/adenine1519-N6)-dimethyltransferase